MVISVIWKLYPRYRDVIIGLLSDQACFRLSLHIFPNIADLMVDCMLSKVIPNKIGNLKGSCDFKQARISYDVSIHTCRVV